MSSERDKGVLAKFEVCCESFPKILKKKEERELKGI